MYNINSGHGATLANALASIAGNVGKVFVVAKSAAAAKPILQEVYRVDPEGINRYFATIDSAVSAGVADRGDVVIVAPGHTEALSNATSLLLDVAGVTIIGLGAGSARPTITLDTATTATIPVSAANVTIKNMIFTANFADIVSVFTLTTAQNFSLEGCYFKATATNMNFLYIVDTDATTGNASGLNIVGCKWIEPDLATLSMVKMDGTNADVTVADNFAQLGVNNNKAALMTVANGKVVTNLMMAGNRVFRLNTDTATGAILFHTDGSTNSGVVANNFAQHADTAAELLITASSGLGTFQNYASGVAGASGYLLPAADS
jgi:hypothetical protein